jgi:glycine cleavage system transcriptional repressor
MKNQMLVTVVGEDKPGIVARLTEVFVKHGANLEESRMSILGGEFAAIVLITLPEGRLDGLKQELSRLTNETLVITTKTTQPLDPNRFAGYSSYEISLNGADHEGIVHKVSGFLRDRSINIQSLDTDVVSAPVSGSPLFRMRAIVQVPPSTSLADLKNRLNQIGDQESVDILVVPYVAEQAKIRAIV